MKKSRLLIIFLCIVIQFSFTGCARLLDMALKNGEEYVISGVDKYEDGEYYAAIEDLKKAEELGVTISKLSDVYAVIGRCYVELGEIDEAFEYYEKALELEPDSVVYLNHMGMAYREEGDYEKAMKYYMKAYEIDPDYPELNASIGAWYIFKDEPEQAISYLEKAIELDPTLAVGYGNLSMAYAMAGDYETAREYMRKAALYGYGNVDTLKEIIEDLEELEED